MKKQLLLSSLLSATILLTACWSETAPTAPDTTAVKNVSLSTAKKDYFTENIPLPGKVAPSVETSLSPQVGGTIKTINVKAGQTVKAGQILATLDLSNNIIGTSAKTAEASYSNALSALSLTAESVKKDLESARVQLENAKIAKESAYATTEKQLAIAQTQLENIQTSKNNTHTSSEEAIKWGKISVELTQKWLDNAKLNLENFKKNSDESMKGLYDNIRVNLNSSTVTLDAAITQADLILWVTDKNRNANEAFKIYLSAKDTDSKTRAENQFNEALRKFNTLGSAQTSDRAQLETKLNAQLDALSSAQGLYELLVIVLNNTIPSANFSQTQIDTMALGVAKIQSGILQTQSGLQTLKNSLSSTKTSIETNEKALKNAVEIAESQLANAKQGLTNLTVNNQSAIDAISGNETLTRTQLENTIEIVRTSRESADNALKIAQAQYASAKARLDAQLVGTRSQADAAKGSKDAAIIQLSNTQIIAPYDGIILSKNIEIGQSVWPGSSLFTIGNLTALRVKLEVSADHIGALKTGETLTIQNNTDSYSGTVSTVSPSADPQSKLFHVELLITSKTGSLLPGDFVDVLLQKKSKEDKVLAIPLSALMAFEQGKYGIYTVGSGSTAILRTVTIGAQNATQVEILSGLSEGENYISNGVLTLNDGDKVNVVK